MVLTKATNAQNNERYNTRLEERVCTKFYSDQYTHAWYCPRVVADARQYNFFNTNLFTLLIILPHSRETTRSTMQMPVGYAVDSVLGRQGYTNLTSHILTGINSLCTAGKCAECN